jgi:hypothetical protein
MVARGIQAAGGGYLGHSLRLLVYITFRSRQVNYLRTHPTSPQQLVLTDSGYNHGRPFTDDKSWS